MCDWCKDIDHVVNVACEDAKQGDKTNPLGAMLFASQVANNYGIFRTYVNDNDLIVLLADGRIICFEDGNGFATRYQRSEMRFNYCPMCGRKLD